MLKKICIISARYPSKSDPVYSFVGTLVEAFADRGVECHVISPVSNIEKKHKAESRIERTANGAEINVYCPRYTMFPNRNIFGFKTYRLTVRSMWSAIFKTYNKHIKNCDAIYSHFIDSGVNAAWLKKKVGIPAFMAVGESNITMRKLTYEVFHDLLFDGLDGVITVSTQLKYDLSNYKIISQNTPVLIAPNGIDTDLFKPLDKKLCRENFGIKDDDYVVSFVGAYIKRKGFDKLQAVIKRHPDWKCILIGAGEIGIELNSDQIIFSGRIPHDEIPKYLSAADVFVLPTEAEGCCNAIIEAMGCALPVVSSDKSFNDDILDDNSSIRINVDSIDELDNALIKLYEDKDLRKKLSFGAGQTGSNLSIDNRANRILSFIEANI